MPKSQEEGRQMMADWNGWMDKVGPALVDKGAGFGKSRFLSAPDREEKAGDPLSGYSIVEASDIGAAMDLARGNPIFLLGGTIEIAEMMQM
jgi:hypothetical protein